MTTPRPSVQLVSGVEVRPARAPRVASWLLMACGVWLVGLGVYFVFLRPPLLPGDPRFIGTSLQQLREAAPGLQSWLKIVFTVMGGFMAGAGVLTVYVARAVVREGRPGTTGVLALAGLLTVVLMSAMNFRLASDFRWVLLVPALAWVAAVVASWRKA